jgi:tRNA pseudouridine13 synthase
VPAGAGLSAGAPSVAISMRIDPNLAESPADDLPRAHGAPVLAAVIRSAPEDFVVEEIDAFPASGSGEHLLLTVEKRGMNTAYAAQRIARWAGVPESAIGHAGLKDRHALTRQRFSVHLPGRVAPDVAALEAGEGGALRVLEAQRHARKLGRGALAGNRFVLTLRQVQGDAGAIEQRLRAIAAQGIPNYFGEQRFGHGGGNVAKALAMFAGRRTRREERALLLSAARSELFNRVLARRVRDGHWSAPLEGEVWMLDGSHSVFGPEPWTEALAQRLAAFDIHPTAPLWGEGELRSSGQAQTLELEALQGSDALALRAGLERAGLRQQRRATRLRPDGLHWSWPEPDVLRLSFALPPGCYATSVLDEIGLHSSARR